MPSFRTPEGTPLGLAVERVVIAGRSGRDRTAVEAHIGALEAIGGQRRPRSRAAARALVGGGVRPARRCEIGLHDPVLGRSIGHAYEVKPPPVVR